MLVCVYRTLSVLHVSGNVYSDSLFNYFNIFDNYYNIINRVIMYSISRNIYMLGDARQMVLDLLVWVRTYVDRTLSFRSSCCEGVCGSCAMMINNLNTLACIQPVWLIDSYVVIYPLPHFNVVRDLVVDLKHFYEQYSFISPFYNSIDSSGFNDYMYSISSLGNLYSSNYIFSSTYVYSSYYIYSNIVLLYLNIYLSFYVNLLFLFGDILLNLCFYLVFFYDSPYSYISL